MIGLNDTSIIVGQIKQLLSNFNLPKCEVGLKNPCHDRNFIHDGYICRWNLADTNYPEIIKITPYIYNSAYQNITTKFPIRNLIYDRETHRYLGRYLRFLRDYNNIDLMSMYNCFDSDISYEDFSSISTKFSADTSHIIYSCPISFNILTCLISKVNYAYVGIYIDSLYERQIDIKGINGSFTSINTQELNKLLLTVTTQKIYNSNVLHLDFPQIIADLADDSELVNSGKYEALLALLSEYSNHLRLLIKIPINRLANIIVLEGKYNLDTDLNERYFIYRPLKKEYYILTSDNPSYRLISSDRKILLGFTYKDPDMNPDVNPNDIITNGFNIRSQLVLSALTNPKQYLIADRLFEYLSGNVIYPLSSSAEILRCQVAIKNVMDSNVLNLERVKTAYYKYGIWNQEDLINLRKIISNQNLTNINTYDIVGYLDKDVEKLLQSIGSGGFIDNVRV